MGDTSDGPLIQPVHATCVALAAGGVMIRGPSGSGKSDLALRLIDQGAYLVADDQVLLRVEGGRLMARSPEILSGMLEVRGIGPMPVPRTAEVAVCLAVDLIPEEAVERLPEPDYAVFHGCRIPCVRLGAFAASTPAKIRLIASAIAHDGSDPWPVASRP